MLDTNVLSELIKPTPDPKVVEWVEGTRESTMYLSVLTLGEIRNGIAPLRSGARSRRLEACLRVDLRGRFRDRILTINEAIDDRWGAISAAAAAKGKPLPVIDGLLAATALHNDLTLATGNASDVATVVSILNPWL